MNKRRRANSIDPTSDSGLNKSLRSREFSLGDATTKRGKSSTGSSSTRQNRRASTVVPAERILCEDSTLNRLSMNEELVLTRGLERNRPTASTPDIHSHGLPVFDTLKKAFRKDSNQSNASEIQSGISKFRLSLSDSNNSRSVIRDSLPDCGNDGSYMETLSKICPNNVSLNGATSVDTGSKSGTFMKPRHSSNKSPLISDVKKASLLAILTPNDTINTPVLTGGNQTRSDRDQVDFETSACQRSSVGNDGIIKESVKEFPLQGMKFLQLSCMLVYDSKLF